MPELIHRTAQLQLRAVDKDKREVEFVAATEAPVYMGWGAPEVLRMGGMKVDKKRGIPFLDAHRRGSALDTLGRSVSIETVNRECVVRVRFSTVTEAARAAYDLVQEGTVDAVSVGYSVEEFKELRAGEFDGRGDARVEGPAVVVTRWSLRELSLVPIGADQGARKRALEAAQKESVVKLKPNKGETLELWTARAIADAELALDVPDLEQRKVAIREAWDAVNAANPPPATPAPVAPNPVTAPVTAPGTVERAPATQENRSIDLELAADLEARKRLILTRCPRDLVDYLEDLLLREPLIRPEDAWRRLLEERSRRMPAGGTPEPRQTGRPATTPSPAPASGATTTAAESNELGRLLREVHA